MRKNTRSFILTLTGPPSSYCTCNKLCSDLEIDHVVPQKFLKEKIYNRKNLISAINDPHNIYRCCSIENRKKGHSLLKDEFAGNEFSGLKARSYLYMIWKYNMKIEKPFIESLNTMNRLHSPFKYEKKRSLEILSNNGQRNPFIYYYHGTKDHSFIL